MSDVFEDRVVLTREVYRYRLEGVEYTLVYELRPQGFWVLVQFPAGPASFPILDIDRSRWLATPEEVAKREAELVSLLEESYDFNPGYQLYRTKNGWRVIVFGLDPTVSAEPDSAWFDKAKWRFGVDPSYSLMCRLRFSYRARVTPKPKSMDHLVEHVPLIEARVCKFVAGASFGSICRKYFPTGGLADSAADAARLAMARSIYEAHSKCVSTGEELG